MIKLDPFSSKFLGDVSTFLEFIKDKKGDIQISDLQELLNNKLPQVDQGKQHNTRSRRVKRKRKSCPECGKKMKFCGVTGIHECKCGYSILEK